MATSSLIHKPINPPKRQPMSLQQSYADYRLTSILSQYNVALIDISEQWVSVAAELGDLDQCAVDAIVSLTNKPVRLLSLTHVEIQKINTFARVEQQATLSERSTTTNNHYSVEQLLVMDNNDNNQTNSYNSPLVDYLQWILNYCFQQNASDIHFEPGSCEGLVRIRIDGRLQRLTSVSMNSYNAMVNRLKILSRMDISERRRPQDGRIKTTKQLDNGSSLAIELRLATLITAHGEKLVVRIFSPEPLNKPFSQMGFNKTIERHWFNGLKQPGGLILVAGPTGSGKTTTLYNSLREIHHSYVNICTVEDPIEMIVEGYNQTQVQHNIGLDFPIAIRALLRQDPDVIMVGEIRDSETADMAMRAALTGHLVLSTIHAENTSQSILRLMDLGVPESLINTSLIAVLSQRLIRLLCNHCKQRIDSKSYDEGIGCMECGYNSYKGRIGIYELMLNNPHVGSHQFKHENSGKTIIHSLADDAIEKLTSGLTSVNELVSVLGTDIENRLP